MNKLWLLLEFVIRLAFTIEVFWQLDLDLRQNYHDMKQKAEKANSAEKQFRLLSLAEKNFWWNQKKGIVFGILALIWYVGTLAYGVSQGMGVIRFSFNLLALIFLVLAGVWFYLYHFAGEQRKKTALTKWYFRQLFEAQKKVAFTIRRMNKLGITRPSLLDERIDD